MQKNYYFFCENALKVCGFDLRCYMWCLVLAFVLRNLLTLSINVTPKQGVSYNKSKMALCSIVLYTSLI